MHVAQLRSHGALALSDEHTLVFTDSGSFLFDSGSLYFCAQSTLLVVLMSASELQVVN
jgi:hypothetical protein